MSAIFGISIKAGKTLPFSKHYTEFDAEIHTTVGIKANRAKRPLRPLRPMCHGAEVTRAEFSKNLLMPHLFLFGDMDIVGLIDPARKKHSAKSKGRN